MTVTVGLKHVEPKNRYSLTDTEWLLRLYFVEKGVVS